MAKKTVLYKLLADGTQPYLALDKYWLKFEWWITEKDWVYLGIIEWTVANMQKFAQENIDFDFRVVPKQQWIDFYTSTLPTVITQIPQPTRQDMIDHVTSLLPL